MIFIDHKYETSVEMRNHFVLGTLGDVHSSSIYCYGDD